ncbi:aminoglycoside adenylyltransferase domain-containing protein [Nocardia amikacinitolerans]|uniref:aminoglycoside adenylyltransferase domain-containing protein n=1 Tax=Nocardia amikacinitolerans TaxID=756689 RepID=UPI0020A2C4D6|nr:aminoglycoside adenylyltransferase domain-containing protein [Nocardia amikacinitolerans]MCP2288211.1 protein of unknown function (DUF4111) [Nocardia amikacinitolerans]
MTSALVDPESLPVEVRPYLEAVVRRTRAVCGSHLVSVFAVGSLALADYRHGRSDVDVTVVVGPALPRRSVREMVEVLAHPTLPCPAVGLELVMYDAEFAKRPSVAAGYLLNLNTGPLLPSRADFDPKLSPAFWYVIDRSIAHQSGRLLYGSPVRQVVAAPRDRDLYAAILASVRAHADGAGHLSDNRVLNGCRSVAFCRTGRWLAKQQAARLIARTEEAFRPLIEDALRSFQRPRSAAIPLPAADVRTFLSWVADRIETEAIAR